MPLLLDRALLCRYLGHSVLIPKSPRQAIWRIVGGFPAQDPMASMAFLQCWGWVQEELGRVEQVGENNRNRQIYFLQCREIFQIVSGTGEKRHLQARAAEGPGIWSACARFGWIRTGPPQDWPGRLWSWWSTELSRHSWMPPLYLGKCIFPGVIIGCGSNTGGVPSIRITLVRDFFFCLFKSWCIALRSCQWEISLF